MAADTWNTSDPRRPHPDRVVLDDDTLQVIDAAVYQLSIYRSPMNLNDGLLRLHALASLIAQADALLAAAVADARDQDHPWSDIARQLGISADTARRRYSRRHSTTGLPIETN
jgi:hypothetical protein